MSSNDQINSLKEIKDNIKTYVIPKLNELKVQLEDSESQLSNCYKINDSSADKEELKKIASEVAKMGTSAYGVIDTIDGKIGDMEEAIRQEAARQEAARQEAARQEAARQAAARNSESSSPSTESRSPAPRVGGRRDDQRRLV